MSQGHLGHKAAASMNNKKLPLRELEKGWVKEEEERTTTCSTSSKLTKTSHTKRRLKGGGPGVRDEEGSIRSPGGKWASGERGDEGVKRGGHSHDENSSKEEGKETPSGGRWGHPPFGRGRQGLQRGEPLRSWEMSSSFGLYSFLPIPIVKIIENGH